MKDKSEQERLHRVATREASKLPCVLCEHEPPSEPCHFPEHHRGMGGAKAGWKSDEWWPGCRHCHDLIDGRLGVSTFISGQRKQALDRLNWMFGDD